MTTEIVPVPSRLPARVGEVAELETEIRRGQAVLDVQRRARASLREQIEVLRRIVELTNEAVDLVDEMREAGELVSEDGRPGKGVRSSDGLTLRDLGLSRRRLSEWRSLRDLNAISFIDVALGDDLEDQRDPTLEKASLNWLRKRLERLAREEPEEEVEDEYIFGDITIRHGDLREVLADLDGQVDAIITDPPYPLEFIEEFDALTELAERILTPSGVLVVMVGQAHLPEYLERLSGHLTYRWCGAYLTDGPATRIHARKVGTKWKPVLVFDRGEERSFLTQDVFTSEADDKRHHGWGQSESGTGELVERFTKPGALVVDPFLGGGTTAVVCRDLGRRFVGCDIDAAAVATARKRLES